jgi:hypothetical protein
MSQTETHIGKLRKVDFQGKTREEWCEIKCREIGKNEIASYNDNWTEELRDLGYEKYFFVNDDIWEAFDHISKDDSDDIYEITPNSDGTLSFVMQFYNGGTCLTECIEEELEKLNKNENEKDKY